jgi:hypothetical protein
MPTEVTAALISSIIGGLLVAIVNQLLTKRRTDAEIDKFKAEADKFRAEAEKIRSEIGDLKTTVGEANYYANPVPSERIIYDGTKGITGYDIDTITGTLEIKDGSISYQSEYVGEFRLSKYMYGDSEKSFLPKNELITVRRLRISYEAKVTRGKYGIFVIIRSAQSIDLEINI